MENDLQVCGEATEIKKAIKDIKLLNPNLVIIEPVSNSENNTKVIKSMNLLFPEIPILVLSCYDRAIYIYAERTIKNRASGYIEKSEPTFKIINAVRRILSGNSI